MLELNTRNHRNPRRKKIDSKPLNIGLGNKPFESETKNNKRNNKQVALDQTKKSLQSKGNH